MRLALLVSGCLLVACGRRTDSHAGAQAAGRDVHAPEIASASSVTRVEPVTRRGQALALSPDEATLIVADEDHDALFALPASLDDAQRARVIPLPGPPAQVVALAGRLYVTVRTLPTEESRRARDKIRGPMPSASRIDFGRASPALSASAATPNGKSTPEPTGARKRNTPAAPFDPSVVRGSQGGLLLALAPGASGEFVEVGRAVLAPDAWGLAITPDERRALVTSAWSGVVSLVDLVTMKVIASANTRREPRGIALTADGKTAYVSHLVGGELTRLELGTDSLRATELPLAVAPARAAAGTTLDAALGYDLVLSPDEQSLYVPRHALGAEGVASWWGAPSVDILDLASGESLAPAHAPRSPAVRLKAEYIRPAFPWEAQAGAAPSPTNELVQPRAVVYRKTHDSLLIASEGWDTLTEVDALAADPAMAVIRVHSLGTGYDPFGTFPEHGGAPSGIALSRDQRWAYVYCRSTFDVIRVELDRGEQRRAHLADDGLPADAAYGRRLFANARSTALSGGLACAACHPEGRDDGYVWRESDQGVFLGRRENAKHMLPTSAGFETPRSGPPAILHPRQTPMLAGRARANGPYGWHGNNKDLVERLFAGFGLHRGEWQGSDSDRGTDLAKIDYLMDFIRSGLLPPPTLSRPLSALEERGKTLFEDTRVGCAICHVPATEFTDRVATPLRVLKARPGFDPEADAAFKTPSLWFVAGTPPYLHDGSAATLEELVRTNADRMGKTSQLNDEERAALVAYLRVL
jgi:YVTN family beta-propeller protein